IKKTYSSERPFGKKDIATGLALLAMAGASVFGVNGAIKDRVEDKRVLQSYHGLRTYEVQAGDTYWDLVSEDVKDNPELKRLSKDELIRQYTSFNGDKTSLVKGEKIYLPNWDSK